MALTLTGLITEVKALVQRSGDTGVITDARVTRWLNEAQIEIARRAIGLTDLETSDTLSLQTVENQVLYSFASFSPAVAHLLRVYYLDNTTKTLPATGAVRLSDVVTVTITAHGFSAGNMVRIAGTTAGTNTFNGTFEIATVPTANTFTYAQVDDADETSVAAGTATQIDGTQTVQLKFKPADWFDETYPEPAMITTGQPIHWTQRGRNVELGPPPSSTYASKDLRVEYTGYPGDLSGSESDIGTATGTQTSTTLQDTNKTAGTAWTVNEHADSYVYLVGGTGVDQGRLISSNTSNTLTITPAWITTPVTTATIYRIMGGRSSSQITKADAGLIFYATSEAWAAAGREQLSTLFRVKFENWLIKFQAQDEELLDWNDNIAFEE